MTVEIAQYARSKEIVDRFREIVGPQNASAYIGSVLIAVNSNKDLPYCTPESIIKAAIQAATLRLSCDPTIGEAYIVPRNLKGVKTATFQIGWRGYYRMALRSGKYRWINDSRLYEGEELVEDRLSGLARFEGHRTSDKWHAWFLAFELRTGLQKTFVMTKEELQAHAAKYASGNPKWQTDFDVMCRKTVYRLGLSRYGVFDPYDAGMIAQYGDADVIEADVTELPAPDDVTVIEPEPITATQAMADLGFAEEPKVEAPKATPAVDVYAILKERATLVGEVEHDARKAAAVWAALAYIFSGQDGRQKFIDRLVGAKVAAPKDIPASMVVALHNALNPVYDDKGGAFVPQNKAAADMFKEAA